jgi:succinate dehydrogenase hydrophobic anchor subunit
MRPGLTRRKGQSIFEYFILTIIVVAAALFFARNNTYQEIQNTTNNTFNQVVDNITVDN